MIKKAFLIGFAIAIAGAQSFDNGSTGADGVLSLTTPGIVVFNPRTFHPPLNAQGDGIYQFTSIYIGPGVIVRMSSDVLRGPVFWLSQGSVRIDGAIDLDGADGGTHRPSAPGAGGYPGGILQRPGYRPEGFAVNPFLVPLVGGFGGSGGENQGGGAGGGALLIASSAAITISGTITANGGRSADGTGGGGGAIRLVAPIIQGTGRLSARGGTAGGADGRIRFETQDNQFNGSLNDTPFSIGKPLGLFLPPDPAPSVGIVSVDGVVLKGKEFSVTRSTPVSVVVEARNIPPGISVELQFFPESGPPQSVTTTPLVGTLELSRARASVTIPKGVAQGYARALWDRAKVR